MRLYLIQHGEALPEKVDPQRPLSEKGREDVQKTSRFIKKAKIEADEVWHSTKPRAKQTAEIIAQTLNLKTIEKEGLKPNDPVFPVAELINKTAKDIIIAGHLPFLSKLSSRLIVGAEDRPVLNFQQAGMVCLEKNEANWAISWMVVPNLI